MNEKFILKKLVINKMRKIGITAVISILLFASLNNTYPQDNITAQQIIQNVQNVYSGITDAKASFTQTIKYSNSKATSSTGTLYIKKENKYRIETGSQTIVTDGITSWSYSPKKKQVVIDNYKETGNTFSPNKYLFQYPENFYSDLEGTETLGGSDVYVLKLKPRESGYVKSAQLWVDKNEWLIKKISIVSDESTTTFTVKNIHLNVGLSDSQFTFTPPEGVEVIDMR
jgi:outer membrane lipoprotein carrier protein